jgi:hypothetical protein
VFVEGDPESDDPRKFQLEGCDAVRFRFKMRLYKQATILLAIGSQASREQQYAQVLEAYEAMILPHSPTPEALRRLADLKEAMRDIANLVDPAGERNQFAWAMNWLKSIGHEEYNPVTLTLFGHFVAETYIAACKTLSESLRPT